MIGICPRCGRELVRSSTPTGKVCFRCASCGGVAITLPVLRESLDVRSIAVLMRSARAAERAYFPVCADIGQNGVVLRISAFHSACRCRAAHWTCKIHWSLFRVCCGFVPCASVFATLGLTTGYLCGIVPIAIGFLTYTSFAWPDLRIRDRIGLMSVYSGIVGLFLLAFPMLDALALDFLSCGVGPIAACLALGAILGRRSRKLRCTAL